MNKFKIAMGSLAGIGFLPGAPGTWASFLCLFIIYPVGVRFGLEGLLTLILAGSALSIWAAEACEAKWGEDPSVFVLDEFAGQSVVFLFTGFSEVLLNDLLILSGGFLLFRIFDVLKPFGINRLQHLPSGFGILLDDLLAGFYALLILHTTIFIVSIFL
ncbi:MAG: phosphatidylglycerophosphatase A [Balneolaceae bacterium]